MRVWEMPLLFDDSEFLGGLNEPPIIGSSSAIDIVREQEDSRWLRLEILGWAVAGLFDLIAFVSLVVWLRDRTQLVPLCLFLFTSTWQVAVMFDTARLPISDRVAKSVTSPLLGVYQIALWYLL